MKAPRPPASPRLRCLRYNCRMDARYRKIQRYQLELLNRNTAHFHEYMVVSGSFIELMLWGMEKLPTKATGNEDSDPIVSMRSILVRLFNDFEVASMCALRGLADQSYGPLRDAIECKMLIRLFQVDPRAATRWLTSGMNIRLAPCMPISRVVASTPSSTADIA